MSKKAVKQTIDAYMENLVFNINDLQNEINKENQRSIETKREGTISVQGTKAEGLVSVRIKTEGLVSVQNTETEGLVSVQNTETEGTISVQGTKAEGLVSVQVPETEGLDSVQLSSISIENFSVISQIIIILIKYLLEINLEPFEFKLMLFLLFNYPASEFMGRDTLSKLLRVSPTTIQNAFRSLNEKNLYYTSNTLGGPRHRKFHVSILLDRVFESNPQLKSLISKEDFLKSLPIFFKTMNPEMLVSMYVSNNNNNTNNILKEPEDKNSEKLTRNLVDILFLAELLGYDSNELSIADVEAIKSIILSETENLKHKFEIDLKMLKNIEEFENIIYYTATKTATKKKIEKKWRYSIKVFKEKGYSMISQLEIKEFESLKKSINSLLEEEGIQNLNKDEILKIISKLPGIYSPELKEVSKVQELRTKVQELMSKKKQKVSILLKSIGISPKM